MFRIMLWPLLFSMAAQADVIVADNGLKRYLVFFSIEQKIYFRSCRAVSRDSNILARTCRGENVRIDDLLFFIDSLLEVKKSPQTEGYIRERLAYVTSEIEQLNQSIANEEFLDSDAGMVELQQFIKQQAQLVFASQMLNWAKEEKNHWISEKEIEKLSLYPSLPILPIKQNHKKVQRATMRAQFMED